MIMNLSGALPLRFITLDIGEIQSFLCSLFLPQIFPDRLQFGFFVHQISNVLSDLRQQSGIKLFAISVLKLLNCFVLYIRLNSMTGNFQLHGIHIRRLLLQLGVLH